MHINARPLLIENGRIIDPSRNIDEIGSILISKGKIVWSGKIGTNPLLADFESLDVSGNIVCPGFIDLHCHLRQPGYENMETIATGTRAAAKGGFTTVCCMPNTKPPLDNKTAIENVKSIANLEGAIRVLPIGCITAERKGQTLTDMRELASAGAVAFSDDGSPVLNDEIMANALKNSIKLGLSVIDHCENMNLSGAWDMNEGATAKKLKLRGMAAGSEESMIERDLKLNKLIGGRLHIAHVSTASSVAIIRKAKADGIKVTAEVTPHHLTLTEKSVGDFNTNAKVNPPLRTQKDIDALIEGINDNTIDIIATDHAPHSVEDKSRDFANAAFGISGFETALGCMMGLVHRDKMSLTNLIYKLTCGPAKIADKKLGLGTLAEGSVADITIFDPGKIWKVDTSNFISKGKNSPYEGKSLKGKVIITIYKGNIVYYDPLTKVSVKG